MQTDFKILSLLLAYPEAELQKSGPALKVTLNETSSLDATYRDRVAALIDHIASHDLFDVQEDYVTLFDRTRSLSLHLFEHVHGESRDRGQAMVDLKTMYEEAGYETGTNELPDYLPMFLEFLSTRTIDEARESLGDVLHIITAIHERLEKRSSPFAHAFAALISLTSEQPDEALVRELLKQEEDDPNDLAALDRIWEEEAVTFGGNAGENSCGSDRLRIRLRAAVRNVSPPQTQTVDLDNSKSTV